MMTRRRCCLQVWPTVGTVQMTTPGTWDALLADLSQTHCG